MSEAKSVRRVSHVPETLTVEWSDGATSEFASVWLRDNRSEDRDAHSGQRLIDILDLPETPRLRAAIPQAGGVRVEWDDGGASAVFSSQWLAEQAAAGVSRRPELRVRTWLEGSTLEAQRDFAWETLATLAAAPATRLAWLTRLVQDGIGFITEVPTTAGTILEVTPLVGRVLPTNYGQTFDVRSVPQPENLAYSDLGLGLHTDNPYREPVPGFQALHALVTSNEGGESLFADGLALAEHLRASALGAFVTLTTTAVPFLYRSENAELYAERPLIQLSVTGSVTAVHYNNRSVAPLHLTQGQTRRFYSAYRHFAALMREPRFQLRTRLDPGNLVVFDNQRVLHGRTAFSSARFPRHLQGCYLSRDSVYSETALLRRELAEARA
ncbi:MAG: gamma-butyrobetaine dioxygenase [Steroidobacteraceae bacterium]